LTSLWQEAAAALEHRGLRDGPNPLRIRIFPQGGLTYVPQSAVENNTQEVPTGGRA
jgi:hypothetical protein